MARHQRRHPVVRLESWNRVRAATRQLRREVETHFPIVEYRDRIGRRRTKGQRLRLRAFGFLLTLTALQGGCKSGRIYAGYTKIGDTWKPERVSRSTAYRAARDLRAARIIDCTPGGGKTFDENGRLVAAANAYAVAQRIQEREGATAPRRARQRRGAELVGEPRPIRTRQGGSQEAIADEWVAGLKDKARRGRIRGSPE